MVIVLLAAKSLVEIHSNVLTFDSDYMKYIVTLHWNSTNFTFILCIFNNIFSWNIKKSNVQNVVGTSNILAILWWCCFIFTPKSKQHSTSHFLVGQVLDFETNNLHFDISLFEIMSLSKYNPLLFSCKLLRKIKSVAVNLGCPVFGLPMYLVLSRTCAFLEAAGFL